ncbi:hypothetical protein RB195_017210 [Necator americanus]|uniref:Uncharacterized protein n=2 Tax=Necator americanus TaxID=51031 RepID=W2SJI0_NECAM|nr:hypothetical protein NECAME_05107 [Necator americanus]ETN69784.1 hypothetical protein NECAME_05107 [Necator americanus]
MPTFFHILRRSISLMVFKNSPHDVEGIYVPEKAHDSVHNKKRRHSAHAELCSITPRSSQREGLYEKNRHPYHHTPSSYHRSAPICRMVKKREKSHVNFP